MPGARRDRSTVVAVRVIIVAAAEAATSRGSALHDERLDLRLAVHGQDDAVGAGRDTGAEATPTAPTTPAARAAATTTSAALAALRVTSGATGAGVPPTGTG